MQAPELPCPGLPRGPDAEPVFHAPWQAQAFALAVQLHQRGLFSWTEWAQSLSGHLHPLSAQAARSEAEAAEDYYRAWLMALEDLVQRHGAGSSAELQRHAQAWDHAAHRTPHGQPIELRDEDFAR
ncbi:MAG: nitrile hydratase accessory protein [Rubrivivax sp.]|nr:nitrile hydratase accessory protein [Rubrivivax sp.]